MSVQLAQNQITLWASTQRVPEAVCWLIMLAGHDPSVCQPTISRSLQSSRAWHMLFSDLGQCVPDSLRDVVLACDPVML